jgi:PTH1 family peptidyl-tRNA hydrolase
VDTPRIVVGLGNPGPRYEPTRHNVGFRVIDALLVRHRRREGGREGEGRDSTQTPEVEESLAEVIHVEEVRMGRERVLLAKPRTFMNRSGDAVAALCRRRGVEGHAIVVVHDDADLELGRLRVRPRGGSGGHNGLRSLGERLGTEEFTRVRLGVCGARRREQDLADYVLSPFDADELATVEELLDRGARAVEHVIAEGVIAAMNLFNRAPDPGAATSDPAPATSVFPPASEEEPPDPEQS